MRIVAIATALALGLSATPAMAAPIIDFTGGFGGPVAGTTVFQTFDSLKAGSSIGTFANVYDVNSDKGARPAFGSTGNFAAVLGGGTYSVSFGPTDVFAFVLGSLDRYNQLTLKFADSTSRVYNGGEIVGGESYAAGNQAAASSNGTVSYTVNGGPAIIGAVFKSDTNSFEFDNLATGGPAVPEPATWGMMILGFGAIGAAMRRRRERNAGAIA
ncbi:PEPxxWA-CTERM sorting domain-containing protein [Sphingomonas sp. BK069]|uniref:PEPxxWA-CTERM sorting domain-containing protein n=1 Tax=Sphingomonas sp. BK069 TaxID=2586979 RepID=UPI0017AB170F|nr:PEPxxWA-CTERM sorting domain-containing protein [Sphingomonas sp. BK069]MBB3348836.1 hypothetical protein [Sphingomonas sp. BK069]